MRQRIFLAFEAAEREPDPEKRRAWTYFTRKRGARLITGPHPFLLLDNKEHTL